MLLLKEATLSSTSLVGPQKTAEKPNKRRLFQIPFSGSPDTSPFAVKILFGHGSDGPEPFLSVFRKFPLDGQSSEDVSPIEVHAQ